MSCPDPLLGNDILSSRDYLDKIIKMINIDQSGDEEKFALGENSNNLI